MSRILVTGATGFLGRHLLKVLETPDNFIVKLDSHSVLPWFYKPFDFIYHLAAHTQAGDWCLTHSGEQWTVNQKINTDVLTFWQQHSPNAKLITIGSSCSYAPGSNLIEADYMVSQPHQSLYTYAMTKRMLYEGCRALNKQYGMKYLYLVPSTLYGADYHRDGRQAHFIFDLIRKIIRGKELGEPVVLWGNGKQTRDLVHVDEFVRVMLALNEIKENEIYNISGDVRTIREYANEICAVVGYDVANITFDRSRHIGTDHKSLNADKANYALGGFGFAPLAEGLTSTVKWYMETGAWR